MRITVVPEGRDGIYIADRDSLKRFIQARGLEEIHNLSAFDDDTRRQIGIDALGADHEVDSVLGDIDRAERVGVLTGEAQKGNVGHAVALIMPADDHLPERLEMYDIGELTDDDLDIGDAVEGPDA